jgi:hypothetical protein
LAGHKLEKLTASNKKPVKEQPKETLVLSLKPKAPLRTGVLRELLKIKLAETVALEIPIACRVVGDAYGLDRRIHMGGLSNSTPKKFTIHFVDSTKVWSDLQWDINGYLSNAIAIRKEEILRTDSHIEVKLDVDHSKLSSLPKGYVFCRIRFYQNGNPDETVDLLVDGFNTESEDRT